MQVSAPPEPALADAAARAVGRTGSGAHGGEALTLHSADGVPLAATVFAAAAETQPAVLVTAAAGVPQGFYRAIARWLATHGSTVYTFDYRGVAASRPQRMRGFEARFEHWAVDIEAVLAHALQRHARVSVLGHSIGGLLALLVPSAERAHRLVLVGAQTAYWRDWPRLQRVPMALLWHGFMPLVTMATGYFPGRALRLGEDLPRGVAMEWAGRPWRDPFRQGAVAAQLARRLPPVHLAAASDDAFATPAALRRVQERLPHAPVHRHTIHPASAGRRRLGHFAPLRPEGQACWPQLRRWLLDPDTTCDGDNAP